MSRDRLYLVPRNGCWYYRRRVPQHVAALDGRPAVLRSTKIKVVDASLGPPPEAQIVAREINTATEARWSALLDGSAPSAAERTYTRAVERARGLGFAYRTADRLADGPLSEILDRVRALQASGYRDVPATIEAVLGGHPQPDIRLSQLATRYFDLTPDRQRAHTPRTNASWRNRRTRAVQLAVAQIGDKPLLSIARSDVLALRRWLSDQVDRGAFRAAYASKILQVLSTMCCELSDQLQLDITNPFAALRLADSRDGQRPPFEARYVADVLLGPTALAALNVEARAVVALIASTGIRPVEIAHARGANIVLNHAVPHLRIRDGLKTRTTARDIPLVGSALAAARVLSGGLSARYARKNDSLTSAIGKYLRENNLLPTPDHSLYSLRHTFKDRLRALQAPEELVDQLMGHSSRKPRYGAGYPLSVLHEWVSRVAYDAPAWL